MIGDGATDLEVRSTPLHSQISVLALHANLVVSPIFQVIFFLYCEFVCQLEIFPGSSCLCFLMIEGKLNSQKGREERRGGVCD